MGMAQRRSREEKDCTFIAVWPSTDPWSFRLLPEGGALHGEVSGRMMPLVKRTQKQRGHERKRLSEEGAIVGMQPQEMLGPWTSTRLDLMALLPEHLRQSPHNK
jgi:hypothetical protein